MVGWGVQFYEFISMYFSLGITEFLFLSTHQNPAGAGLTRYEFAGPIFCLRHEVPVWEAPVWVLALVMVMRLMLMSVILVMIMQSLSGMRGAGWGNTKKLVNRLIQKFDKSAEIVMEIFVLCHDISIKENITSF